MLIFEHGYLFGNTLCSHNLIPKINYSNSNVYKVNQKIKFMIKNEII